ncbi:DUF2487 family protein [Paenibacillus radicis (ex Gao et al. 2016)]|uniref:DUF2487 family protein n=1 Tax=Paenibacillus radicis (ex Gao et al. 2016) TaxID=1737354 RepID=A0A917GVL7_9BACL|nr:DUF2487 family protein [Paenibacillus radicis (ex Gao et al. 2016)]GGG58389.1 hypothetical protein GCM10010918_09350 [Paenibacillus radicis (ex Gao et al. 2016)]
MKFSDIAADQWEELKPYLDTCLLPVTGMTGSEQPYEATQALEKLRDIMDLIEIPFKGRVVTYPALHYIEETDKSATVEKLCARMKDIGFKFVILVSAAEQTNLKCPSADLLFTPDASGAIPAASTIAAAIQSAWIAGKVKDN